MTGLLCTLVSMICGGLQGLGMEPQIQMLRAGPPTPPEQLELHRMLQSRTFGQQLTLPQQLPRVSFEELARKAPSAGPGADAACLIPGASVSTAFAGEVTEGAGEAPAPGTSDVPLGPSAPRVAG